METQQSETSVSVLNGCLTIEDRPEDANPWALVDNQTGDEISVCPEEVPSMITLFRAFRRSVQENDHPRARTTEHDCTEHTVSHDVEGLEDEVSECTICGQMSLCSST